MSGSKQTERGRKKVCLVATETRDIKVLTNQTSEIAWLK